MARFIEYFEEDNIRKFRFSKKSLEKGEIQGEFLARHLKNWGVDSDICSFQDIVEVFLAHNYVFVRAKSRKDGRMVRYNGYLFYKGHLLYEFEWFNHEDSHPHRDENLVDSCSINKRNYELQDAIMSPQLEELYSIGGSKSNYVKFNKACYAVLVEDNPPNVARYMEEL